MSWWVFVKPRSGDSGNRIARGTRVSTYRRAFRGSNQAGIHRVCCRRAAAVPHPAAGKCIIEPRVRVTRRTMTRESAPGKSGKSRGLACLL